MYILAMTGFAWPASVLRTPGARQYLSHQKVYIYYY